MFKIFDLNMNEIPFPDGLMPLEIFVGSIAKERISESVPGRSGVVDYGFNYRDRPVELFMRIKSDHDWHYRTLRNKIYELFDVGEAFYLAEADVPSRVLKVVVDESYIPDRLTENYADIDVICRTLDSVFWESIYTTKELHDTGYDAAVAKYGLVDNIDASQTQYEFTQDVDFTNISSNPFKLGFIDLSTGVEQSSDRYAVTSNYESITPGTEYIFRDKGSNEALRRWHIYEYDSSGGFIRSISGTYDSPGDPIIFTAQGSQLKAMAHPKGGYAVDLSDVGNSILPHLGGPASANYFSIWNAGNVTVEPESMHLIIRLNYAYGANGVSIKNLTTGESFILNTAVSGSHVVLDGMNVSYGSINGLRDSNRQRIRLLPGKNDFEIVADSFEIARVNFKFYYR